MVYKHKFTHKHNPKKLPIINNRLQCINRLIILIIIPPFQVSLIYKRNEVVSRTKRRTPKYITTNIQYIYILFCRMAYSRSLDKSFDGVRDMKVIQTKNWTSIQICLTIVQKTKSKPNTQVKTFLLWLGFKIMNALNARKNLPKELIKVLVNL